MLRRLFAIVLFAVAVSVAQPAQASALTISYVSCYSTGGSIYYPGFGCEAYVSGGTGSYTYTWVGGIDVTVQQQYGAHVFGVCRAGGPRTITLTVTDSASTTTSRVTQFNCGVVADG